MSAARSDLLLDEIEAIYRERYPSFLRVTSAITGDTDAGHDAVQEGFARAVRGRHGYRGHGTLEAWLWRAVVNSARTQRRAFRSLGVLPELVEEAKEAPEPSLRTALAALPERQRLVVFLRYFADLDYNTIARVAGIRTGTVSATLSAARESLRATLKEELHA